MVQGANKNIALVKKFKRNINKSIKVDKLILYGSRAKGNFHRYSDFDLLILSPDFKGIPWYKRPTEFYLMEGRLSIGNLMLYSRGNQKKNG